MKGRVFSVNDLCYFDLVDFWYINSFDIVVVSLIGKTSRHVRFAKNTIAVYFLQIEIRKWTRIPLVSCMLNIGFLRNNHVIGG